MAVNKAILAIGLLVVVYSLNLQKQCGLVCRANWRTLQLYWPFAVVLVLTLLTGINFGTPLSMFAIILAASLAVAISAELMFRGLLSSIDSSIIIAQAYFAAGLGVTIAYARSQDYSIMIPILVHALFDFIALAAKGGALDCCEYVGDDMQLAGTRSFTNVIAATESEIIMFGWVIFASRAARNLANEKVAADTKVVKLVESSASAFDAEPMVYGGFQPLVLASNHTGWQYRGTIGTCFPATH